GATAWGNVDPSDRCVSRWLLPVLCAGGHPTSGPWLGRSFAVGAPQGSACGAGRPRRALLCLSVSVACPNQYVRVITKFCTKAARSSPEKTKGRAGLAADPALACHDRQICVVLVKDHSRGVHCLPVLCENRPERLIETLAVFLEG